MRKNKILNICTAGVILLGCVSAFAVEESSSDKGFFEASSISVPKAGVTGGKQASEVRAAMDLAKAVHVGNDANRSYYCSFATVLEKSIQVEGRKQLGIDFGSADKPDCRGLTLEEMQELDFTVMDFTEVVEEKRAEIKYAATLMGRTLQGNN